MMRFLLACLMLVILSSCSLWDDNVALQPQLQLNIQAATNINPNVKMKPSPLELRVYQLSDSQAFNQADFVQIFNDPQGVLKTDLLVSRQLTSIFPGERRDVVLERAPGAKYVGIIGGFADYRNAKNKIIFPLDIDQILKTNTIIKINIDDINLDVTGGE